MEEARLEVLTRSVYGVLAAAGTVSEYELLRRLREAGEVEFPSPPAGDTLALFRQHFLLFHLLYRLRDRLLVAGEAELSIGALRIALEPYRAGVVGIQPADPLRAYYLDLERLRTTTVEEVEALLAGFWRRVAARDEHDAALALFDLSPPVDLVEAKRRYRRLAMRHHPDRGGDGERLKAINQAMEVLVRCYGRPVV